MSFAEVEPAAPVDPEREAVCSGCSLVYWRALGHCPTCAAEGGVPSLSALLRGELRLTD